MHTHAPRQWPCAHCACAIGTIRFAKEMVSGGSRVLVVLSSLPTSSRLSGAGTPAAAHSESNSELAYGIGCGISETTAGFWVISLKSGGPAEAAGIMKGDIVLAVDGFAGADRYLMIRVYTTS